MNVGFSPVLDDVRVASNITRATVSWGVDTMLRSVAHLKEVDLLPNHPLELANRFKLSR
jgi:hypothetical protein